MRNSFIPASDEIQHPETNLFKNFPAIDVKSLDITCTWIFIFVSHIVLTYAKFNNESLLLIITRTACLRT